MEPLINKENLKRGKYQAKCTERGYLFMPFVCGSLGGFSDDAVVIMKEIGAAIAVAQGISKGVAVDRIRKRIAFAIQKAQAMSWIRRGVMADVML